MDQTYSFGYWLRRRRRALDITQAELAARAGCSPDLVQKIEADARRPSRQLAERLAAVLGLEGDERAAFVRASRAALAADALPLARRPVEPEPPSPPSMHARLPSPLTPLVGREEEVGAICALVRQAGARFITLTGPGGVGKTRLALQAAAELREDFPDGAHAVDLAPLRDPALVASAIADALDLRDPGGWPALDRLRAHLRGRSALLLLDNFEHLLDAAPLVTELLAAAPRLRVLVTSREHLRLRGERVVAVPPLALPDLAGRPAGEEVARAPAVALFLDRARAARGDLQVTAENARAIAEICVRLDGLPLAIELAAAQLGLFSPGELLGRLQHQLALLRNGPRDLPARQQTMRDTIAWSYELLRPEERALLRRLGVFVGGFTLAAAERIAGGPAALDGLAALIGKSLLLRREVPGGAPRYVMLETIRAFALDQLEASGEAEQLRREHAAFFLAYGEARWLEDGDPDLLQNLAGFRWEADNMRAALAWSVGQAGGAGAALRLAGAMARGWHHYGMWQEATAALEGALALPDPGRRPADEARARMELATFYAHTSRYREAQQSFERALQLERARGDRARQAQILERLGSVARERGDAQGARRSLTEAHTIFRSLGDTLWMAVTLNTLASVAILEEDVARAEELLDESELWMGRSAQGPLEQQKARGWTLNHRGLVAQLRGEWGRAVEIHEECARLFGETTPLGLLMSYHSLGESLLGLGRLDEADAWLRKALALSQQVGSQAMVAWCLSSFGSAAALAGDGRRAGRLWGAAERLLRQMQSRPAFATRPTADRAAALARAQLGAAALEAALAEGRALPMDRAIDLALRA